MNYSELLTANTRSDDYVNATTLCKAFGVEFSNFSRLDSVKALVEKVGHVYNLQKVQVMEVKRGKGTTTFLNTLESQGIKCKYSKQGRGGGTYLHPLAAIKLAEWLSPEFEVAVKTVAKRFQCLLQQTGSRQPHARVSG